MQLLDGDDDDESGNEEGRGGGEGGERRKIGQEQEFHGNGSELVPPQSENSQAAPAAPTQKSRMNSLAWN